MAIDQQSSRRHSKEEGPRVGRRDVSFSDLGAPSALGWPSGDAFLEAAQACQGHPEPLVKFLAREDTAPPLPGAGRTRALWEYLATVASIDLAAARTLEPHLDAAAILHEAGETWEPGTVWGVYAAESGTQRLQASAGAGGTWRLSGTKPWCSLAGLVTHAVVSAHVPTGRRAFAVDLGQPEISPVAASWASRGLAHIPSGPLEFRDARARAVGGVNWYLDRPGFALGAVGVAACWFGGAVGLFRSLHAASQRRELDQLALAWLGQADRLLHSAASVLADAATHAEARTLSWRTALRVRGHVAEICQRLLTAVGEATGPWPLAWDEDHARRVADLGIYILQHHAARDDAALGRHLLDAGAGGPW